MYARLTFSLCLILGACSPRQTGALTPDGYKHAKYDYAVQPLAGTPSLLPEDWAIDNLYVGRGGDLEAKDSGDYTTKYRLDTNGDGKTDVTRKEYTYDLRYVHRVHSGVVWLRTVPTPEIDRDRALRVLMQDYLDRIAGGSYELVGFDEDQHIVEKRFATELLARGEGTIADVPAYAAEFAVANIDQLQVTHDARRMRVKLVLIRPGFAYEVADRYEGDNNVAFPVLLIAGFASQPEDYASGVADFDEFVSRVKLNGQAGMALKLEPEGGARTDATAKAESTQVEPAKSETDSGNAADEAPETATNPATSDTGAP